MKGWRRRATVKENERIAHPTMPQRILITGTESVHVLNFGEQPVSRLSFKLLKRKFTGTKEVQTGFLMVSLNEISPS